MWREVVLLASLFALGASVQQSDHLQAKWGAPIGQASEACSARLLALCLAAGLVLRPKE